MSLASGQITHDRPACHVRTLKSVSSLYIKNERSNPPSWFQSDRSISRKHPVMASTSRTESLAHLPRDSGSKIRLRRNIVLRPVPRQKGLHGVGLPWQLLGFSRMSPKYVRPPIAPALGFALAKATTLSTAPSRITVSGLSSNT